MPATIDNEDIPCIELILYRTWFAFIWASLWISSATLEDSVRQIRSKELDTVEISKDKVLYTVQLRLKPKHSVCMIRYASYHFRQAVLLFCLFVYFLVLLHKPRKNFHEFLWGIRDKWSDFEVI